MRTAFSDLTSPARIPALRTSSRARRERDSRLTVLPEQEAGANGTVAEADDSCDGSARSLAEPTSILLVEDDEGDALIVRRVLAASAPPGWKLSVAVRLDDARQWLLANTAECILLDLSLPDAVGLESVEGIHSAAPEVPIVVLSGLDDELMARASLKHGAQDYLTKGNVESVSLWKAIRYAAERKHTEMVIRHQAEHDALTGLANRSMFVDRLKLAISRLGRTGMQVGVLFIDLDRFKWVNDSLGHEVGDELIVEVARRISRVLRPGDLAARLGGDEFLVLVDNVTKPQDVLAVARRMHAALGVPFEIGDRELRVTASVGISLTADPRTDPVTAVRDADVALYRAKAHGKARSELFDAELSALARARLELEGELHRAVERQEFLVHYQPVVDLRDGHVVGAEALVRWMHPSGRLVGPKEFIAVAEEIGLIVDIGEFVLRNACEQVKKWQTAGHAVPLVSVNLSPRQLSDPQLADRLATILAETGVDPGSLCLEVTENGILADEEATWESLRRLSAMGIRLGLDDFGTGYSSLTHLRRYAFDILKVDQSFTAGLGVDAGDTAIVEAVVALARVLKMQVVVEGVETPMQADYLRRLGCELAQGFLFAKPAPAAEVVLH